MLERIFRLVGFRRVERVLKEGSVHSDFCVHSGNTNHFTELLKAYRENGDEDI